MRSLTSAAALAAASVVSSAALAQDMTPEAIDIVEVASASGHFETLIQALLEADLAETVATTEDITVFAPIDEAFDAIQDLDGLLADPERLTSVLRLHVVPSIYLSEELSDGEIEIETLGGETLTIARAEGQVTVTSPSGDEAMIVEADIEADNGVIHAINAVLTP